MNYSSVLQWVCTFSLMWLRSDIKKAVSSLPGNHMYVVLPLSLYELGPQLCLTVGLKDTAWNNKPYFKLLLKMRVEQRENWISPLSLETTWNSDVTWQGLRFCLLEVICLLYTYNKFLFLRIKTKAFLTGPEALCRDDEVIFHLYECRSNSWMFEPSWLLFSENE